MHAPPDDLPRIAADILSRLRERRPRVHCMTNNVAQAFTANVLLAVGALPSMTISPNEIAAFVARCDALLINLGTFDDERRAAIEIALQHVAKRDLRWVLDPVFIDRSPLRAAYARALANRHPTTIRLNEAEFLALSAGGADENSLAHYAARMRAVLARTGATDVVTDGARIVKIGNGHPLMALVTAMGCAGSALIAACHVVEDDPLRASATALIVLGIAGEMAGARARGPGDFAVEIIDALHLLDREILLNRMRVT